MIKALILAPIAAVATIGLVGCAAHKLDNCSGDGESRCVTITLHYDAQGYHPGDCIEGPKWEIDFIKSHGPTSDGCV